MASYTKLQKKDVLKLCNDFSLNLIDFSPMEGGAANSSFLLHADQGDYVLTVFDEKTGNEITQLARLLTWLLQHNFPTTQPILPNQGKGISYFENKPIMLKPFIEGQVYTNLTTTMLHQVGMAMSKLHQIAPPTFVTKNHQYGVDTFASLTERHINVRYESWLTRRLSYFKKFLPQNMPVGLIHGDLFADNVLFDGIQLQAFIDFENACHYYKLFDLGMGIVGMCVQNDAVVLEKARAFVAGYECLRPLSPPEKTHLQLFVDYAATATSSWRFWKYCIDSPDPEKAEKPWQMVSIADNVSAIPNSEFIKAVFE